ncbi:MAG: hypothetical protein HQM09_02195 [Candidatus Riflebacteria bacterium]|nr:hypothetical protein [Candidatus Riflebacteria bacterium]
MTNIRLGFSMIEIALVVIILGLALLPILSTFSSSHQNTRVTLEEIIATNFASELLEALQALPYDQIQLIPNNDLTMDSLGNFIPDPFAVAKSKNNFPGLSFKKLPQNFKVNLTIEPFPLGSLNSMIKALTLNIKWGARNQEIQLMTLKGAM